MSAEDDEIEFEKEDSVEVKGTGETGRILGPGSLLGSWRVRLVDREGKTREAEFAKDEIEPII